MKFSSPANIALASIALSSPSLLSSPAFAHAAPVMESGFLSPNPGVGYFGTSPQFNTAESPNLQAAAFIGTPPAMKIAGRRRSLKRAKSVKFQSKEKRDALGLGIKVRDAPSPNLPGSPILDRPSTPPLPVQNDGTAPSPNLGSATTPLASQINGAKAQATGFVNHPDASRGALPLYDALGLVANPLGLESSVDGLLSRVPLAYPLPAVVSTVKHTVLGSRAVPVVGGLIPGAVGGIVPGAVGGIVPGAVGGIIPTDPLSSLGTPVLGSGGQLANNGVVAPPNTPAGGLGGVGGVLGNVNGVLGNVDPANPLGSIPVVGSTLSSIVPVPTIPDVGKVIPTILNSAISQAVPNPLGSLPIVGPTLSSIVPVPTTPDAGKVIPAVLGAIPQAVPNPLGSIPVVGPTLSSIVPVPTTPDVGKVIPNIVNGAIPQAVPNPLGSIPVVGPTLSSIVPVPTAPDVGKVIPAVLGAIPQAVPNPLGSLPVVGPTLSSVVPDVGKDIPTVLGAIPQAVPNPLGSIPVVGPTLSSIVPVPTTPDVGKVVPSILNGAIPQAVPALPTEGLIPNAVPAVGDLPSLGGLPSPGAAGLPLPDVGGLPVSAPVPIPVSVPNVPSALPVAPGVGVPNVNGLPLNAALPAVGALPIPPLSGAPPSVKLPVGSPAQVVGSLPVPTSALPSGAPVVDRVKQVADPLKIVSNSVVPIVSATASIISAAPVPTVSGLPNPLPMHDLPVPTTPTQPIDKLAPSNPLSGAGVPNKDSLPLDAGSLAPVPIPIGDMGSRLDQAPGPVKDVKPVVKRATADMPVLPLPAALVGSNKPGVGVVGQVPSKEGKDQGNAWDKTGEIPTTDKGGQKEPHGYRYQVGDWDGDEYDEPEDNGPAAQQNADDHTGQLKGNGQSEEGGKSSAVVTQSTTPTPTNAPTTVTPLAAHARASESPKPTTSTITWGAGGRKRTWMSRLLGRSVAVPRVLPIETGLATNTGATQLPRLEITESGLPIPTNGSPASHTSIFGSPSLVTPTLGPEAASPIVSGSLLPTSSVYLDIPRPDTRSASLMTLRSVSMVSIETAPVGVLETASVPVQTGSAVRSLMASATGVAPIQPGPHASPSLPLNESDSSLASSSSESPIPSITITQTSQSTLPPDTYPGPPLTRTTERAQSLKAPSRLRTMIRSAVLPTSTVAITTGNTVTPSSVPSPTASGTTGTPTATSGMGATRRIFRWGVPGLVTSTIRSVATGQARK